MEGKHEVEIYSPRYEGNRFEDHRFPVDLLEDLLILKKMTIEMAKAIYLEKNPNRKRIPNNFTHGISIKLESIEPGSAVAKLVLVADNEGLFPQASASYFEEAPEKIKDGIEAAYLNQGFTDIVPNYILNNFNQLGSNLRDDERIVFGDENRTNVILDKESRKRLVLASSVSKEYNGLFELRGIVSALDKKRNTFEIRTVKGEKIKGNYTLEYLEVLQDALVEMENGRKVFISGTGTFNAADKLMKIESLREALSLDPLDVPARLEELSQLAQGWLDGVDGEPLDPVATKWLGEAFDQKYDSERLPMPATFPTPEGNVQFEWSINNHEVSLMASLENRQAEFYALNTQNLEEISEELDLTIDDAWKKLNQLIETINE